MGLFKTKCQLQLRHSSGVQHRETLLSAMERNEILGTTEEEIKEWGKGKVGDILVILDGCSAIPLILGLPRESIAPACVLEA